MLFSYQLTLEFNNTVKAFSKFTDKYNDLITVHLQIIENLNVYFKMHYKLWILKTVLAETDIARKFHQINEVVEQTVIIYFIVYTCF